MIARDLERLLPEISGRTTADLDIRFRKLRGSGALPLAGRGRHAPRLQAHHLAAALIGVGGSVRATDAARAVADFGAMREMGWADGDRLSDVLAAVLGDVGQARRVHAIRFCHSHPYAVIERASGRERLFSRLGERPAPMRIDGAGIRDLCVVSGDLVYCLAQELARQCGAPQIVAA